ncbi:MAG: hypothetical protein JWP61_2791 [Friedmanniella sp.]|nr:hypothetical protein [Friedmanniella sp.]
MALTTPAHSEPQTGPVPRGASGGADARPGFTSSARTVGLVCAVATASLSLLYLVPLLAGLASLPSSSTPIGEPWFSMMEILILVMAPFLLGTMVAVQGWARPADQAYGSLAVVFMALLTVLTCSVHFVILALTRRPEFSALPFGQVFVSFHWLSATYALDVLAWDVFFALSALCAALVFRGGGLVRAIRVALLVSGFVALVGVTGVVLNQVPLRNVGIAGYAGVFPVAAVLLAILFRRTAPSGVLDRVNSGR